MLFIGGRAGTGKTSVASALHELLSVRRVQHAVIEGDYLDMAYPTPWEHGLEEQNLQAIWRNYRALGYRRLIYTNVVSVVQTDKLVRSMGDDPKITAVLLDVSDEVMRERLILRESGLSLERHLQRRASGTAGQRCACLGSSGEDRREDFGSTGCRAWATHGLAQRVNSCSC